MLERRLSELQEKISLEKNQSRIGQVEDVFAEGPSKVDGKLTGRTRTHRLIHFAAGPDQIGKIVKVKVTAATSLSLQGDLVI